MKIALQIVEFHKILEELCLVRRDNRLTDGSLESDADHAFKLTFLAMMIAPYLTVKFDYARLLELCLIHDIVEARSGDYSLSVQTPEVKKIKKQKEKEAIEYYKTVLPSPINEKIYDIFLEYEERETREAQIAWCLDKIEANLQGNLYKDGDVRYWAEIENGEWYYSYALKEKDMVKKLDEDIIRDLEQVSIQIMKRSLEKCSIKIDAEKTA